MPGHKKKSLSHSQTQLQSPTASSPHSITSSGSSSATGDGLGRSGYTESEKEDVEEQQQPEESRAMMVESAEEVFGWTLEDVRDAVAQNRSLLQYRDAQLQDMVMLAVDRGRLDLLAFFVVECRLSLETRDLNMQTALTKATAQRNLAAVEMLVYAGASWQETEPTRSGTVLHFLCGQSPLSAPAYLLVHDMLTLCTARSGRSREWARHVNSSGQTARDVAVQAGHHELVALFDATLYARDPTATSGCADFYVRAQLLELVLDVNERYSKELRGAFLALMREFVIGERELQSHGLSLWLQLLTVHASWVQSRIRCSRFLAVLREWAAVHLVGLATLESIAQLSALKFEDSQQRRLIDELIRTLMEKRQHFVTPQLPLGSALHAVLGVHGHEISRATDRGAMLAREFFSLSTLLLTHGPSVLPPNFRGFVEVRPADMAALLTALQCHYFQHLAAPELHLAAWTKPDRFVLAPTIVSLTDVYNRLYRLLTLQLLFGLSSDWGAVALAWTVDLAQALYDRHDYQSLSAVLAAISGDAGRIAQRAIAKMDEKARRRLERLQAIFSPSFGFREYRRVVLERKSQPFLVFLAPHLRDFFCIAEKLDVLELEAIRQHDVRNCSIQALSSTAFDSSSSFGDPNDSTAPPHQSSSSSTSMNTTTTSTRTSSKYANRIEENVNKTENESDDDDGGPSKTDETLNLAFDDSEDHETPMDSGKKSASPFGLGRVGEETDESFLRRQLLGSPPASEPSSGTGAESPKSSRTESDKKSGGKKRGATKKSKQHKDKEVSPPQPEPAQGVPASTSSTVRSGLSSELQQEDFQLPKGAVAYLEQFMELFRPLRASVRYACSHVDDANLHADLRRCIFLLVLQLHYSDEYWQDKMDALLGQLFPHAPSAPGSAEASLSSSDGVTIPPLTRHQSAQAAIGGGASGGLAATGGSSSASMLKRAAPSSSLSSLPTSSGSKNAAAAGLIARGAPRRSDVFGTAFLDSTDRASSNTSAARAMSAERAMQQPMPMSAAARRISRLPSLDDASTLSFSGGEEVGGTTGEAAGAADLSLRACVWPNATDAFLQADVRRRLLQFAVSQKRGTVCCAEQRQLVLPVAVLRPLYCSHYVNRRALNTLFYQAARNEFLTLYQDATAAITAPAEGVQANTSSDSLSSSSGMSVGGGAPSSVAASCSSGSAAAPAASMGGVLTICRRMAVRGFGSVAYVHGDLQRPAYLSAPTLPASCMTASSGWWAVFSVSDSMEWDFFSEANKSTPAGGSPSSPTAHAATGASTSTMSSNTTLKDVLEQQSSCCGMTASYLMGWLSGYYQVETSAYEMSCRGRGASQCRFVVLPRDAPAALLDEAAGISGAAGKLRHKAADPFTRDTWAAYQGVDTATVRRRMEPVREFGTQHLHVRNSAFQSPAPPALQDVAPLPVSVKSAKAAPSLNVVEGLFALAQGAVRSVFLPASCFASQPLWARSASDAAGPLWAAADAAPDQCSLLAFQAELLGYALRSVLAAADPAAPASSSDAAAPRWKLSAVQRDVAALRGLALWLGLGQVQLLPSLSDLAPADGSEPRVVLAVAGSVEATAPQARAGVCHCVWTAGVLSGYWRHFYRAALQPWRDFGCAEFRCGAGTSSPCYFALHPLPSLNVALAQFSAIDPQILASAYTASSSTNSSTSSPSGSSRRSKRSK